MFVICVLQSDIMKLQTYGSQLTTESKIGDETKALIKKVTMLKHVQIFKIMEKAALRIKKNYQSLLLQVVYVSYLGFQLTYASYFPSSC